ncbi:MAG TPA: hypothetical protein VD902_22140, partial [Symbiobacteriaceae bacterium]|nr:hypothetical protein [Symbiobacteriaceae bacterium]
VACLEEYFRDFALYNVSRALEGWSLAHLALFYQAMGRHPKALEYFQKAYRWHSEQGAGPQHLDEHRADLIWQSLKLGDTDAARPLLAESAVYLQEVPNDLDARARYLNNQAYLHYLSGGYTSALDAAIQVVHMRGVSALRKAQACLTLHYTAKAMGHRREAMGLGTLVRIQASLGRRPDLEEEATRSMLHMQQDGGLPLMDELFRSVTVWAQRAAAARTD